MKLAFPFFLLALPALGNTAALDTRQKADKVCSAIGSASINCRGGPSREYPVVRKVQPEQSFGVRCIKDGEGIDGEK
ncbi:hypothetical protein B0H67DRAFT_567827 [Lasiosphaeris hirsuta]|uniref:Uncharacterized protein n=1 Tax=Lasiosphaeris hirsuta TaxID=260670 RepID=A0AA40AYK0_9PEZI|nr:hypothetical protein B0H67DRAFT_567827 [Lasiosphaeris hirsuta]